MARGGGVALFTAVEGGASADSTLGSKLKRIPCRQRSRRASVTLTRIVAPLSGRTGHGAQGARCPESGIAALLLSSRGA